MTTVFSEGAGQVLAADVRTAIETIDEAMLCSARMYVSVLEIARGAAIAAGQSQKVIAAIGGSLAKTIEGRANLVDAMRHLHAIKAASNLAETNYGCPTGAGTFPASARSLLKNAEAA